MNKKIMFILGGIVLVSLLIIVMVIPPKEVKEDLLGIDYNVSGNEASLKYDTENPVVAMYVEKYGTIIMELYPSVAPNTVNNFISLIKSGFYDGKTFHRLDKEFVLQGGSLDGEGHGGPGYTIKGEFSNNGFSNTLSHEKWVVSMARSNEPNSAGSQFFICVEDDSKVLDGRYAAFGRIIDGFDNIKNIVKYEKVIDGTDTLQNKLKINKVLIDLKGREYAEVEKLVN